MHRARRARRCAASTAVAPLLAALSVWAPACGYHFTGFARALPGNIGTLRIGEIRNETREFDLPKRLAFALEREVVRRGAVRLVEEPGGADAVLEGAIRRFDIRPVSFDASDLALQYEATIVVDLYLKRSSDGKTLWEATGITESEEYGAVSRVVVTSSSQFQRGTLNPLDLPQITDIQLAEAEKRHATERLLSSLAKDAYAMMAEEF